MYIRRKWYTNFQLYKKYLFYHKWSAKQTMICQNLIVSTSMTPWSITIFRKTTTIKLFVCLWTCIGITVIKKIFFLLIFPPEVDLPHLLYIARDYGSIWSFQVHALIDISIELLSEWAIPFQLCKTIINLIYIHNCNSTNQLLTMNTLVYW